MAARFRPTLFIDRPKEDLPPRRGDIRALRVLLPLTVVVVSLVVVASAAAATGSVWTWGANGVGELGNGSTKDASKPVSVLANASQVAGGQDHSLAVVGGHVWAWGNNLHGQLGDGTSTGPSTCGMLPCSTTPVAVKGLSNVVAVAAGVYFSLALRSDGTVYAWGWNNNGELGDGTTTSSSTPVPVSGLSNVIAIAAGGVHALALLSNHTVMAWGANNAGQLGQLTNTGPDTCFPGAQCSTTPVLVKSASGNALQKVDAIAAGDDFSLAMFTNVTHEEIDAWGDNVHGQLGNGTTTGPDKCGGISCGLAPAVVGGNGGPLIDVRAIAASGAGEQALAVLSDGSVAAWGDNAHGQVGNGCSTKNCPNPMLEGGVSGATAVATSGDGFSSFRSMALESSGQVVEWGSGPLGNGTTGGSKNPVNVTGMSAASAIAAGGEQSLAIAFPPNNRFHVRHKTVTCPRPCRVFGLRVMFPGPGIVEVRQAVGLGLAALLSASRKPLIKPTTIHVTKAGAVRIKLKLTAIARKRLRHKHKLRVKVLITFTPTGGKPASKTVTVTVRLPKHR